MADRARNGFKLTWRSTLLGVLAEISLVAGMIVAGLLVSYLVILIAR